MIIIKYKSEHDSPLHIVTAHKITWLSVVNVFILYGEFNNIIKNMSPYYIEIESIENYKSCLTGRENE